ncbi:MAG: protein-glutamate O-methyltransferase CheR [Nitrosomonadales bacterium]|nr:protein-glutamate O-methyltransferase CheR [Nitrosomonadales bacterium]
MSYSALSDQEFASIRQLIFEIAGITLAASKKPLVSGRLGKRVQQGGFASFGEYHRHIISRDGQTELQIAVDLLTTNETYFFREHKHFDYLHQHLTQHHRRGAPFRVWSAACSSGEEPYSIAMLLSNSLGEGDWEILASDLSTRVLERARSGHYAMERTDKIPREYLGKYCLKGIGSQEGTFLVEAKVRSRIQFMQINLNRTLPKLGEFDVIFLRNVMIYFDMETKRQVVSRLLGQLKPGGHLLIGHSESLNGVTSDLEMIVPSVYRKP